MTNKNDQLVVGMYANESSAKTGGDGIKDWDHADKDVKLGAIAVITYDHKKDKLHYHEMGQRSTKSGAGWGTAIGATIGILTGGLGLIPGMAVGAAAGGALGAFNHKNVGVTDDQQAKLIAALKDGGAALGIMADDFEVDAVIAHLAETGADISHYKVDSDAAEAITAAAAAQVAASAAVDENAEAVDDADVAAATKAVADAGTDLDADSVNTVGSLVAVTGMSVEEATAMYNVGIEKASDLMEMVMLPDGRAAIAEASGLDSDVVLYYAKELDLMRVKGVGVKYATLLLASGVDTVPELATRNSVNLAKKLAEVNATEAIVVDLPSQDMTAGWVAEAKELPRMLYY